MENISKGLSGQAEMIVGSNDTAARVGSGTSSAVLATPVMISLVEEAALAATEHLLPTGKLSLGTHLDVSHIAATPVGMQVVAMARVSDIDGTRITYHVEVRDAVEVIAEGTHARVVVTAAKFQKRVDEKADRENTG